MTTLIVWRLMEAPLGTSRFARLLESYRLATKQPPPPGLVLVHNQLSAPTLAHEKSFRAWWAKPAAEIIHCNCGWRPDLGDHYRVHRPGPIVRSETCSLNRLADSRFGPSKA
jgi:hypothetical protein